MEHSHNQVRSTSFKPIQFRYRVYFIFAQSPDTRISAASVRKFLLQNQSVGS